MMDYLHPWRKAMPKRERFNDTERAQWIDNDEGLYYDWRRSGMSKWNYIRANRAEIDEVIRNVTSGSKPAHYKRYGP